MTYKPRLHLSDTMIYKFAMSSQYFFNDQFTRGPKLTLGHDRLKKIHANTKDYLVSTSYDELNSHAGLTGEAFIFNKKLIFSFGGAMGYRGIAIDDLYEAARIYVGLETNQLNYALNFINKTKAELDHGRYDKVYTTGFSLGGTIAERCYYSGGVDKVIKFDAIDSLSVKAVVAITVGITSILSNMGHPIAAVSALIGGGLYSSSELLSQNEPDNNIISISAGFNLLTGLCSDDAGIKVRGEDCNYRQVAQSILYPFFLNTHDDLVIGSCYVDYSIKEVFIEMGA